MPKRLLSIFGHDLLTRRVYDHVCVRVCELFIIPAVSPENLFYDSLPLGMPLSKKLI